MRTTSSAIACLVRGRPELRFLEPSYFLATSRRYQRRIVSGVTMPATRWSPFRPRTMFFTARCLRLIVVQPKPSSTKSFTKDAILLHQILDDLLLVAVHPAREQEQEEAQGVRW